MAPVSVYDGRSAACCVHAPSGCDGGVVCSAAAQLPTTSKPSWGCRSSAKRWCSCSCRCRYRARPTSSKTSTSTSEDQRGPEGQSMHTCTPAQATAMGLHPAAAALLRGCTERGQAGVRYVIAALLISPRCWPRVSHEPVNRCQLDQARTRKCLISHAHMPSAMAPALATRPPRSLSLVSRPHGHTATRRFTRHLHQALRLPRFRVLGDCTRPLEAWPCGLQCRPCRKARQTACQGVLLTVPGQPAGFTIVVWDSPYSTGPSYCAYISVIPIKWACG
jgi:hypothetical protein